MASRETWVEHTDGVDGQHGCTRIELSSGSQHPSKGFGASSRAQAKLVRETGTLEVWPKRLGQRAADQAPKDIADDEGADPRRPTRKGYADARWWPLTVRLPPPALRTANKLRMWFWNKRATGGRKLAHVHKGCGSGSASGEVVRRYACAGPRSGGTRCQLQ